MSTAMFAHRRASDFEPLALLQIVRQVAEQASVDPRLISTRSWDTARELSDGPALPPAARRICEHLRLPWKRVLAIAFMTGHGQRVALGHALGDAEPDWLTEEYCSFALSLIARRQGVPTLTPGQYGAARHAMLGAARGARRPVRKVPIPTADQIETIAGSWDEALAQAGLAPRSGLGGQQARVGPVPIVEVLERCYEHYGTEPTLRELVVFAQANGIPFPRKERGRPFSAYVEEWKAARKARRLTVPDGPPPKAERPDYSHDVGAALPGECRAKSAWADREEVVEWVAAYLAELQPHEHVSQRDYDAWARTHDGAPWASVLQRHGGWLVVRQEAWQRVGVFSTGAVDRAGR